MNKKTKVCPRCGCDVIVRLSSIDKILCNQCKKLSDWTLKPGQPSDLINGKKGGVE